MWLASFQLIVDFMALLGTGAMIFIMVFTVRHRTRRPRDCARCFLCLASVFFLSLPLYCLPLFVLYLVHISLPRRLQVSRARLSQRHR